MSPPAEMPMITASSLSALGISVGLLTFARSAGKPFVSMGVTTMKMINNTSMMSAIGITFGADICGPTEGLYDMDLLLSACPARNEVVHQFHRGVVHFDVKSFDFVGEVVVRPHGRHSHKQTERGCDQRFGNTASDGGEPGRLGRFNTFERVDDADHGAEQSDERSRRADGREAGKAALHFGVHDGHGAIEAALGSFNHFHVRN